MIRRTRNPSCIKGRKKLDLEKCKTLCGDKISKICWRIKERDPCRKYLK